MSPVCGECQLLPGAAVSTANRSDLVDSFIMKGKTWFLLVQDAEYKGVLVLLL